MIGVAISTTDARNPINNVVLQWQNNLPKDAILIVYNDANYQGIAKTKNRCLKLLEDAGVTDYFLADNDVWPISKDWWKPYLESSENHLMYNFKMPSKPKSDMQELYRDKDIVAYSHTRGALLYVTQKVLDTVGGMDTRYRNGFEHPDWTNRIYNAGLTTYRSMDVPNSDKLFYCLDQDARIKSSIQPDRNQFLINYRLYSKNRNSKDFMEYKI